MFTIHVTGLVICVFAPTRLELLFLDASGSDHHVLPHHLPSLIARRSYVRSYSLSRLASLHGRFAGKFSTNAHFGWSIEGMMGDGGDGCMPIQQVDGVLTEHPDPKTPDWSSLHWVLDLNRMLPKAKLRDEYRRLGQFTNAVVRLRGGRVRGGNPFTKIGNHIWGVGPGYIQALTDSLDIQFDEPPSLEFRNSDNAVVGDVHWEREGEAWLINESPGRIRESSTITAATAKDNAAASCEDSQIYAEAMGVTSYPVIQSVRTYEGGANTGIYCEVCRVEVSE